jgi:hypothetical protein
MSKATNRPDSLDPDQALVYVQATVTHKTEHGHVVQQVPTFILDMTDAYVRYCQVFLLPKDIWGVVLEAAVPKAIEIVDVNDSADWVSVALSAMEPYAYYLSGEKGK